MLPRMHLETGLNDAYMLCVIASMTQIQGQIPLI